jgi:hypothetical protein
VGVRQQGGRMSALVSFTPKFRISVRVFIEKLGVDAVRDAMERACCRCQEHPSSTRYFCGICWSKVREAAQ